MILVGIFLVLINLVSAEAQQEEAPWPMFQHDPQHTGSSPFIGPGSSDNPIGQILIEGEKEDDYFGTPVIGSDGTLYLNARITKQGETKQGLYAYNGNQKWIYEMSSLFGMPVLSDLNNTVYIFSQSEGVLAIDIESGILKWKKNFNILSEYPVIGSNGILYFLSFDQNVPYLTALDDIGEVIWSYAVESGSVTNPAIDKNGIIYFGNRDTLFAINPDGSKKWQKSFPATLVNGS